MASARRAAGISQAELGRRAGGYHYMTVSRIERGVMVPSAYQLVAFGQVLQRPIHQLFNVKPQ